MITLYENDVPQDRVLVDVLFERVNQDCKWGVQNHKDGTTEMLSQTADNARIAADRAAKNGTLRWAHILNEEFYEAMAEEDPIKLRKELVQVAAVAVAWIECIDRRKNGHPERDRSL